MSLLWTLAWACSESGSEEGFDPDLSSALQEALDRGRIAVGAPGATAAVCVEGGGRWVGASGLVDEETGDEVAVGDAFRIGSITKTYVAALTLLEVEDGHLGLDDVVESWRPGLLERGAEITVRMLLSHTSGLPSYTDIGSFLQHMADPVEPEEVITWSDEEPDRFEPGQGWEYSNTNYFVLALVLEEVTGEPWHVVQRRRLLDPLGLDRTWVEQDEPDQQELVTGHLAGLVMTVNYDPSWGWASGGMVSTAAEQVRWLDALLGGEVLSAESLEAMTTPTVLPDGTVTEYGLGLYLVDSPLGPRQGHTGSTMGFQSDLFRIVGSGWVVAALVNDFAAEASDVSEELWQEF